jgi:aminoglycoside phosphotransferase (APT) family kinase protein
MSASQEIVWRESLTRWLAAELGADRAEIREIAPLSGGAIQENWRLHCVFAGGREAGERRYVLRKDARSTIAASRSRLQEFALVRAAHDSGVTVPRPVAACADANILGAPFAIYEQMSGVGLGPKVVKDISLGGDRAALTERLARELALIHKIALPRADLDFLGVPPADPARAAVQELRAYLDTTPFRRPGLEWGLRWAELQAPAPREILLTHRDFRTGNYMVDGRGLTAVLDWEFAAWGDPMVDIGWFCARCWRFGRDDLEAGGIGDRAGFYRAYESASGRPVDDDRVRYWEIVAHLRWAAIALLQGWRHASGAEPSLALALTGRIADELEYDVLRLTPPGKWARAS